MLDNMNKIKTALLISLLLLGAFLVFALWSDRNRAAIFGSRGHIDKGSKFGLEIGDDKKFAELRLTSLGMTKWDNSYIRQYSENGLKKCHAKEFSDEHTIDFFRDMSWRRGNVCLASLEGKIVHISWHYGMFQP